MTTFPRAATHRHSAAAVCWGHSLTSQQQATQVDQSERERAHQRRLSTHMLRARPTTTVTQLRMHGRVETADTIMQSVCRHTCNWALCAPISNISHEATATNPAAWAGDRAVPCWPAPIPTFKAQHMPHLSTLSQACTGACRWSNPPHYCAAAKSMPCVRQSATQLMHTAHSSCCRLPPRCQQAARQNM